MAVGAGVASTGLGGGGGVFAFTSWVAAAVASLTSASVGGTREDHDCTATSFWERISFISYTMLVFSSAIVDSRLMTF